MTALLEHARLYLGLGFAVLPLHFPFERNGTLECSCGRENCRQPAKHPFGRLVRKGMKEASKDATTDECWFANTRLNIGIATGAASGIIVLDIDLRHDGHETLAVLESEHGALPATWRFLSGGGGEHIVLRHPGARIPNSAGRLGPGIDLRGDGGYIVAPPSVHICGRHYAISVDHHPDDVALADAPHWLLRLIGGDGDAQVTPAAARPAAQWRELVGTEVAEGRRNATAASLAGYLLRNRVDPWVTLDLLLAWNRIHCRPPLDDAEVATTVRSIANREVERREGRRAS
jgi:putative DNA primase/helicase